MTKKIKKAKLAHTEATVALDKKLAKVSLIGSSESFSSIFQGGPKPIKLPMPAISETGGDRSQTLV